MAYYCSETKANDQATHLGLRMDRFMHPLCKPNKGLREADMTESNFLLFRDCREMSS